MSQQVSENKINPVDFFNTTKIDWMFNTMLSRKNVTKTGINSFSYVINKEDEIKRMVVIENGFFIAREQNGLGLEIDKLYTPFMLLQKVVFKNKFMSALNYVMYELMFKNVDYIRVGTKYFKKITKTDRNGIVRNELKVWDKMSICDDYGKDYLDKIEKYDDFTMEPNNKEYVQVVGFNYNLYSKFEHKPCVEKDYVGLEQFYWTNTLLEHIFGEQYEIGLKYIKVLYDLPKQKLPILVLTSDERGTGKTTFIDWLELLFGANSVIINPENISAQFNGAYADKNLIMIEESRFESTQATEKLKNLATQKKILVNTKHVQHYSIPFHGKIVITSNDENKFSKVDDPEIRYWVRSIPTLKGKANHNIMEDLTKEVPFFLYYLSTLENVDTTKSRQVFESEELLTEALVKVKKESLPGLHKDIVTLLEDHSMNNTDFEVFEFTAKDIKNKFFNSNTKVDINYINRMLRDSIKLNRNKMKRYHPLICKNTSHQTKVNGRPYVYKNKYYGQQIK